MAEFHTSLLREKFVIHDTMPDIMSDEGPVIALSNRIIVPLVSTDNMVSETFVVRAQNMHSCLRMAAHMVADFYADGSLLSRAKPYDWEDAYKSITKGYEAK